MAKAKSLLKISGDLEVWKQVSGRFQKVFKT